MIKHRECVSHHYACDCREAKFKELKQAADELADVLYHAIEMGQYTPNGSTEGWAKSVLADYKKKFGGEGEMS